MISLENVHQAFGPSRVLRGFMREASDGDSVALIDYSGSGTSVAIRRQRVVRAFTEGRAEADPERAA